MPSVDYETASSLLIELLDRKPSLSKCLSDSLGNFSQGYIFARSFLYTSSVIFVDELHYAYG